MTGEPVTLVSSPAAPAPEAPATAVADIQDVVDLSDAPSAVQEINDLHREITQSAMSSLGKAIRIGHLLSEEKSALKHGEWLPWLKANVSFSERMGQRYMLVFRRREELTTLLAKYDTMSFFSLSDALRLLEDKYEKQSGEFNLDEPDVLPLDSPEGDNVGDGEGERGEAEPDEEEAEGLDSQLSTTQESPQPEPPEQESGKPDDSQKIPESNIERLADQIWKGAIHYAPAQELDVARSLLKLILRKFPELKGDK